MYLHVNNLRKQVVAGVALLVLTWGVVESTAQTQHFIPSQNTGINATLLISDAVIPTIDGTALAAGDEIGVYTPEGVLAGAALWTGENLAVTLWGDDNLTTDITEGFAAGDSVCFRIWDADASEELPALAAWSGERAVWSANLLITNLQSLTAVGASTDIHYQVPPNSGVNATLLLAADLPVTIDGISIEPGDEIGVYTADSVLAGSVVWSGKSQAIPLWGDDGLTDGVTEGFTAGDAIAFRIWDADAKTEYLASAEWTGDEPGWAANALIQSLASLTVVTYMEPPMPPTKLNVVDTPGDDGGSVTVRFFPSLNHPGVEGQIANADTIDGYVLYCAATDDSADAVALDTLGVDLLTLGESDRISVAVAASVVGDWQYYWISAYRGDVESARIGPNRARARNNGYAEKGDLSGDGEIDIWDVAEIATVFGVGEEYDPVLDLNGNGEIDIWDVAAIAAVFGQSVE